MKQIILIFLMLFAGHIGLDAQTSALSKLKEKKAQAKPKSGTPKHKNKPKSLSNHTRPDDIRNDEVSAAFDAYEGGDTDLAIEQFESFADQDAAAAFGLGVANYYQNNYAAAIQAFEQAIELDPYHTDAMYWLGQIYEEQGEYAMAADYLLRLLEIDDTEADAWWLLGYIFYASGYPEDAQTCLDNAVEFDEYSIYSNNIDAEYGDY